MEEKKSKQQDFVTYSYENVISNWKRDYSIYEKLSRRKM